MANIEGLMGGSGNDYLYGNSSSNYLSGGAGADTLDGEGGNDFFFSGSGADTITTGTGNDVVYFDASAFSGKDTISDFVTGQDVIDLTDVFTVDAASGKSLANYVQVTVGGELRVDVTGNSSFSAANAIADLTFQTTGGVNILYDDNTNPTDQNGVA